MMMMMMMLVSFPTEANLPVFTPERGVLLVHVLLKRPAKVLFEFCFINEINYFS